MPAVRTSWSWCGDTCFDWVFSGTIRHNDCQHQEVYCGSSLLGSIEKLWKLGETRSMTVRRFRSSVSTLLSLTSCWCFMKDCYIIIQTSFVFLLLYCFVKANGFWRAVCLHINQLLIGCEISVTMHQSICENELRGPKPPCLLIVCPVNRPSHDKTTLMRQVGYIFDQGLMVDKLMVDGSEWSSIVWVGLHSCISLFEGSHIVSALHHFLSSLDRVGWKKNRS